MLEQTFMVRVLRPSETNLKKRVVKSPKVYIRDSGVLRSLLEIEAMTDLYGHPAFGASWEGRCIEQITSVMPLWHPSFYRTSSGEEIDLVLESGQRRLAFEIKASLSPHPSRGFPGTLEILKPGHAESVQLNRTMKKVFITAAPLLILVVGKSSATKWHDTEAVDPISGRKVAARKIVNFGSYVYSWNSKYDMVFGRSVDTRKYFNQVKTAGYKDENGRTGKGRPYFMELVRDRENLMGNRITGGQPVGDWIRLK